MQSNMNRRRCPAFLVCSLFAFAVGFGHGPFAIQDLVPRVSFCSFCTHCGQDPSGIASRAMWSPSLEPLNYRIPRSLAR
ncbi:hypothetical protein HDK90DRAFT_481160 [Phyllosticta capitalensis]|uniref:Secreted protein n=1 Tax=Phyllosticta capitalensis TaxID=121624 RepID=A0ABR1YRQ8_9PEZI